MPEYSVDLGSIIIDAKDSEEARELVRKLIVDNEGKDVQIDQAIEMEKEVNK